MLQQAFQQNGNTIANLADKIPGTIAPALEECKRKCYKSGYSPDSYSPSPDTYTSPSGYSPSPKY